MKSQMLAVSWNGLPQYAARLLRAAFQAIEQKPIVIGTRPEVPVCGMELILPNGIHWVTVNDAVTWKDLGLQTPKLFIQSGWAYPVFNRMGNEVRKAGGNVVLAVDNRFRFSANNVAKAFIFRITERKKFVGWFCPGKSGRKLGRAFGFRDNQIWEGLYGADDDIFYPGLSLDLRQKQIVFIGRYVPIKNILNFVKSFLASSGPELGWRLILFGTGPQKHSFPKNPNVVVQEFMQPEKLGKILRESRALVLPSISDAWGLVVHEAALSGCALLLSSKVGSTEDFATVANAIVVDPSDDQGWRRAINEMVDWTPQAWQRAEMSSLRAAESHGKRRFADSVCEIVRRFG